MFAFRKTDSQVSVPAWVLGFFLAAFCAALTLDQASAQIGDLDWPEKQIVQPRDIPLSYKCGDKTCDLSAFMERQHVCALVVVSAGDVVLHRTSVRADTDRCKTSVERERYGIASITKTIVSLLFGFVHQDPAYGAAIPLDTPAAPLLVDAGVPGYDSRTTLRQLLQMSSGMRWSEDEIDEFLKVQVDEDGQLVGDYRSLKEGVNARLRAARFNQSRPFHYSGFDTQLLGILTEHRLTSGKGFARGTLDQALERFLWQQMPMQRNAEWNADFDGRPAAHCCAYTSARDLARLGQWVMEQYKGKGAIADWVRASMTDTVDANWSCRFESTRISFRYGYQWWVPSGDEADGFTGIGTEGQYLHIFPEQDVVIAQLGEKLATDADTCEAMLVHRMLAGRVSRF